MGMYGDAPSPPDYGPMAEATKYAADSAAQLGRDQMVMAKGLYEDNKATMAPTLALQRTGMEQQQAQAKDYYDYQINTFRPVEQGLVRDAENFSTEGAREGFAATAAADMQSAQANQEGQNSRAMASMGINPNSGRFQAITGAQRVMNAANRAGASTKARTAADSLGWAKRMDVTGLGRGLAGASTAAYAGANNSGNSVNNTTLANGSQYSGNYNAGVSTQMGGLQMGLSGNQAILGAQNSQYTADMNNYSSPLDTAVGLATAGAKVYSASDPRVKMNVVMVGKTVLDLNLYEFNYIDDPASRYRGVMSTEVALVMPEAVIKGADFDRVDYGMLGIEMERVN